MSCSCLGFFLLQGKILCFARVSKPFARCLFRRITFALLLHNTVITKLSIALCFFQMMEKLESSIIQTEDKLSTAMQEGERTVGDAIFKLDACLESLEALPVNQCSMVRRLFLEIWRIDLVRVYVLTYAILDELRILSVSLISDKQCRIRRDHSAAWCCPTNRRRCRAKHD